MQDNTRHKHKRGPAKTQGPSPRSRTATVETAGQLHLSLTLPLEMLFSHINFYPIVIFFSFF